MAYSWQHGCPDRQDPQAPTASPLGSDTNLVHPLMPEQVLIGSSSSLAQFPAQDQGAAQDDWYDCSQQDNCKPQEPASQVPFAAEPKLADVGWPEDPGVDVQWADEAPKSPFALASGGAEALAAFFGNLRQLWLPKKCSQIEMGGQAHKASSYE